MYGLNEEAAEFPFRLLRILYSLILLQYAFTGRLCLHNFYLLTLNLKFPRQKYFAFLCLAEGSDSLSMSNK